MVKDEWAWPLNGVLGLVSCNCHQNLMEELSLSRFFSHFHDKILTKEYREDLWMPQGCLWCWYQLLRLCWELFWWWIWDCHWASYQEIWLEEERSRHFYQGNPYFFLSLKRSSVTNISLDQLGRCLWWQSSEQSRSFSQAHRWGRE